MDAGCGSKSRRAPLTKAEYVKQMKAIGTELEHLAEHARAADDPEDGRRGAGGGAVRPPRRPRSKLEAITPPENVQTQHAKLVEAVDEFADELDPVIKKLRTATRWPRQLGADDQGPHGDPDRLDGDRQEGLQDPSG